MNKLPVVIASKDINAVLVLANGQFFFGQGIGKEGTTQGELCFNTSLTGYQEILTDPSYTDQIINFTMPHIGNVGTNSYDRESDERYAAGLVVRDSITNDSNFRSEISFNNWLREKEIVGISGIDTREVTSLIRDSGVVNAIIYHANIGDTIDVERLLNLAKKMPSYEGLELSSSVSTSTQYNWDKISNQFDHLTPISGDYSDIHIVVIDYGVKHNILNCLLSYGCKVTVVNCKTDIDEIIKLNPDGVFLSNGPGDPAANIIYAKDIIQNLLERKIPIFGICMGHQLLSLSSGLTTYKMHQGHRGTNHPVKNLLSNKVEITSQNHGFCVSKDNLPDNVEITHISLFDNTVEGIRFTDRPAFSVQYHPESSGGPHDSRYLFGEFISMIKENKKLEQYA